MDEYLKFLYHIKMEPRTYKSNFARERAYFTAEAASRGHITALNGAGVVSGVWTLTASGVRLLKKHGRIQ